MRFGTRWQRVQSYATVGAWFNAAYLDDDQFTFEDVDETLYAGVMLGLIWSPQIALAIGVSATPLSIVEGAALVGLGVSFAIGGVEGAETYVDYINPVNWKENVKDPEKVEALVKANRILQAVTTLGGSEIARAGRGVIDEYKHEIFRNRFVTGPMLPF